MGAPGRRGSRGGGRGRGRGRGRSGGRGGSRGGGFSLSPGGPIDGPPQVRKQLRNLVGRVLGDAGESTKGTGGRGRGARGRGKGGRGQGAEGRVSRRQNRKRKRAEKKTRREHYFGKGRQLLRNPDKTQDAEVIEGQPAKKAVLPQAKKATGKRKRSRADDDDEEITSDDGEGAENPTGMGAGGPGRRRGLAAESEEEEEEGEEEVREQAEDAEDKEEEAAEVGGPDTDTRATNAQVTGRYVPPHLRGAGSRLAVEGAEPTNTAELQKRQRQLRGIMNRVSEGNLDPSGRELAAVLGELVPEAGSLAAAEALLRVLLPAAVGDPNMSILVLGCHAALAVATHVLFGAAFGAAALLRAGAWLRERLPRADAATEATGEDARVAKNCVSFLCLLFSFGLLPGMAIFDLVRFIFEEGRVSEVRIELALTVLRYAGRRLRAECPQDFREVLKFVNETASAARNAITGDKEASEGDGLLRVDYLLRELQDLRNNKVSFAAMDRFEAIRSWLKTTSMLRTKKVEDHQLAVPFRYLAEEAPANWPLGAAGAGQSGGRLATPLSGKKAAAAQDPLRALAVAQRLSTEIRQSLFVALMGAEDYEHAADRLAAVATGAKVGPSEASLVVFHCAVRERVPNPFYEHVATALCERPQPWGMKFRHSLKRAAVQNLQQAHGYGLRATVALAELCAALVTSPSCGLPLAVLRFMKFGAAAAEEGSEEAGPGGRPGGASTSGLLLRHLAESVLRRAVDGQAAAAVFSQLQKYDDVRQGMLLVFDGLVKPRLPPRSQAPELWEKLREARRELARASAKVEDPPLRLEGGAGGAMTRAAFRKKKGGRGKRKR